MSNIPDTLKTQPLATIDTMHIETSVLEPLVINQNFCRFVLEKKGILDAGSSIQFSLKVTNAGQTAWLPIKTGIHSLIKSAVLRIGTKVIANTDDYAYYQTIRRQFKTPEEKSQKDMVKSGTVDVLCPDNMATGMYQIRDANYQADLEAGLCLSQYLLNSDPEQTPVYSIKISDLFPMMRSVQLPLYLISQPTSIELTFNTQPNGVDSYGTLGLFPLGYGGDTEITLNTHHVKFLCDYLTYDDSRMEETAKLVMSETGMTIPYEDIVLTSTQWPLSNPAPAAGSAVKYQITRDLGLSGMMLRSILVHMYARVPLLEMSPLGKYSSNAYNIPETIQIRINDKQIYPREISSETQKAHQLAQVFGTELSVQSCEYSLDTVADKSTNNGATNNYVVSPATYENYTQPSIIGTSHYLGADFTISPINNAGNGILVGQKPVQFMHTITNTDTDNFTRDVRYFSLIERPMMIKGGEIYVSS